MKANSLMSRRTAGKHFFLPEPADSVPLEGLFTVFFIEAPSGDLVSAYILAIDSEDERKVDVLLRFYTALGERAVLLYRDTIAFVSETMPEPGDTVTVKSSREFSKDVMLNHRFPIG